MRSPPASLGIPSTLRGGVLLITAIFLSGIAMAETPLERGAYLVRGIAGCGNCHTARDPDEKPIAAMELAGGRVLDDLSPVSSCRTLLPTTKRASEAGPMSKSQLQFAKGNGQMAP